MSSLVQSIKAGFKRAASSQTVEEPEGDTTLLQVAAVDTSSKTPRRSKRATKPRYSQIATPYVPGHLVADESVYPPVQPRLHPAERSVDDVSAFQEAMDRAQAAFYEVSSPVNDMNGQRQSRRSAQTEDPFLPSVVTAKQNTQPSRRRKPAHLPTFQEESDDAQQASAESAAVTRPSAKSLGKRREVSEEINGASAEPESQESPEKIKKIGTFDDSRHAEKQNGVGTKTLPKGMKSRPARPKTQATSKLPTRQAARTEVSSAKKPAITPSEHLAREAAIRARREKRSKG